MVEVEEGQTVWLAWVFETMPGVRAFDDSPNGGGRASSGEGWAYGMPSDFGTSTLSYYKYTICANYIAADEEPQVTLIGNPYMYTGRRYDIETGLYYYRARYYNPYIGRFLQVDPARQGMNWYAYCGNNSINYVDPTGCIYSSPFSFSDADKLRGVGFKCTIKGIGSGEYGSISSWVNAMTLLTRFIGSFVGCGPKGIIAIMYGVSDVCDIPGWKLSRENESYFWYLMAINEILPKPINPSCPNNLDVGGWFDYKSMEDLSYIIVDAKVKYYIKIGEMPVGTYSSFFGNHIYWNPNMSNNYPGLPLWTRFPE